MVSFLCIYASLGLTKLNCPFYWYLVLAHKSSYVILFWINIFKDIELSLVIGTSHKNEIFIYQVSLNLLELHEKCMFETNCI